MAEALSAALALDGIWFLAFGAVLAGLVLGGAKNRQLVCVDGFISTAAYLAAWKICPTVMDYCIISHASAEPGHKKAVETMGLTPYLDLGFRLGEGTGAACAMFPPQAARITQHAIGKKRVAGFVVMTFLLYGWHLTCALP